MIDAYDQIHQQDYDVVMPESDRQENGGVDFENFKLLRLVGIHKAKGEPLVSLCVTFKQVNIC